MTGKTLLAVLAIAAFPTATMAGYPYPGSDHDTLGECYDYVVNQYNDNGDEEGLDWGLDNCDDAYAEMAGDPQPIDDLGNRPANHIGGGFIILAPASLSDPSNEASPTYPRR